MPLLPLLLGSAAAAEPTGRITFGTPGVSFHQVANWVAVRALERLGHEVTVVDNLPHPEMYPLFLGPNASIDFVTGSDLPFNHAPYIANGTDQFVVVGTVNEATDIVVAASAAAGLTRVSDLAAPPAGLSPVVVGLDAVTCPACGRDATALIAATPALRNFTYRGLAPFAFRDAVRAQAQRGERFVAVWYTPCWLNGELPELATLAQDAAPFNRSSQGKTLARLDRLAKLGVRGRAALGAVFVGNRNIVAMDTDVNVRNMTPAAAADAWIAQHPETFDSFFY